MSAEHVTAVFDQTSRGGSHLVILLTIAIYSDHHGEWYADQATLQKRARLTRRRVKQVLDDLVDAGELAVVSRHGRGRLSNYRLLIGPKNVQQAAPIPEKKGEAESTFSAQKAEAESTFPTPKQEADSRFSHPPCPPFPPHPQSPLNPPEKLKQEEETFGLPPAPSQPGPAGFAPDLSSQEAPISSFPAGQDAVFRVNLLLEGAAIPLPSPSQIGLWSKALGGIEPLLELLSQLIQAGLANKRNPSAYIHRVVLDRAAHPKPAASWPGRRSHNPMHTAGADDRRREQARLILETAKRGDSW